jgi:drug/metabolite transporter (DMT)-like permease
MTTHAHARHAQPIGIASRLLLTTLGAAGLVAGAFLPWTRDIKGVDLEWRAVYHSSSASTTDSVLSIGGGAVLLGLLAVLGLAERSGWLTRVAGALGVIGVVLVIVNVERSTDHGLQWGLWVALAGSILCLAAGMSAMRETARTTTRAVRDE